MAYTEGLIVMRRLFRTGGMEGVTRFLAALDRQKTRSVSRLTGNYQNAIRNPDAFQAFVSRFTRASG